MKNLPDECVENENRLTLWVGGDLDSGTQAEVDAHLAVCARCSERAAIVRVSRAMLREGLALEARASGIGLDPWPRIRQELRREGLVAGSPTESVRGAVASKSALSPGSRRTGPARREVRWAVAVAAAVLGLLFAWAWLAQGARPSRIDPQGLADSGHDGRSRTGTLTQMAGVTGPSNGSLAVQTVGLRRLLPGERRLRDTAQIYQPNPFDDFPAGMISGENSLPVSLERPLGPLPK